jgi:hypothetical protein
MFPPKYCVIGDAAKYDNFNFFGSQLRIRIEMAFGMMTCKWGIYWRPLLLVDLDKIKFVVEVVARFHDFCINERILVEAGEGEEVDPVVEANVSDREIFQDTAKALAEYEAIAEEL